MIRLSQLKQKEIIMLYNGKRLGYIYDIDIHTETGKISHFYIQEQDKGHFFQKKTEKIIAWQQIIIIGADVILVSDPHENQGKITE